MGILLFCIFIAVVFYFKVVLPELNWKRVPTLREYRSLYPQTITSKGTKCNHCSCTNIRQGGWETRDDVRRLHYCNQCNMTLYRSEL